MYWVSLIVITNKVCCVFLFLLVTPTEAAVLERNTRQQAKSLLWKAARWTRLTASSFGEAAERESWTRKGLANLTSSKELSRVRAVS